MKARAATETVVFAAWPSLHDVPGLGASTAVFVADALVAGLRALGADATLHLGGDDSDPRVVALAQRLGRDAGALASDRAERTLAAWKRYGVRAESMHRITDVGGLAVRERARVRAKAIGAGAEAVLVGRAAELAGEADALQLAMDDAGTRAPIHRVIADVSLFEGGACGRTSGKGIGLDEAADVLPPDAWRLWLLSMVSHEGPVETDFRWEDLAARLKTLLAATADAGPDAVADAESHVRGLCPADALRSLWPARRAPAARSLLEALLPQIAARLASGEPILRATDLFHAQLQLRYREAAETRLQAVPFEEAVALASIE